MCDLFDAGLDVGHSVGTPDEACELAASDAAICTSLWNRDCWPATPSCSVR